MDMKMFPEMTEKMNMLLMDIIAALGQLPVEQRGYIFGFEGEEDMRFIDREVLLAMEELLRY